jgi:tellurite resistance protein TerC
MDLFRYLHYGLSAVLCFIGIKMLAHPWLEDEAGHSRLPHWVSLAVIAGLLGISIVASLLAGRKEKDEIVEDHAELEELAAPSPDDSPQAGPTSSAPPQSDDGTAAAASPSESARMS